MKRAINIAFVVLVLACATSSVDIPANQYGLRVVPDRATYEQLVRSDPEKRLVSVASLGIPLDIHYATADNFMHETLYPVAKAYVRAPAARALADVEKELAARGVGLKVFDGYRPYRVTEAMWKKIHDPAFVANPKSGSRHNRGAAVDVTLIDLRSGEELKMPTPYDDFTPRAHQDYKNLPADVLANRALLRDVMSRHGFQPLPTEWWHFDYRGWKNFELMDVPLEDL